MPASLELVKIALQAYANGDCEIALALAGPHIRWDERASRPEADLVWGHDKVERAMRRYLDGWQEYRFELEELAEVGPGKVVGICRERGTPAEGPLVDRRFGGLWVVENGKIVSWVTYLTPREAVRAAKELIGPQAKPAQPKPVAAPATDLAPKPVVVPDPPAPPPPEPVEADSPKPVEVGSPESVVADTPEQVAAEAPAPFDFEAAEPAESPVADRPRTRILTKSEEQKRAARARAQLRKRASRQSA
jgi:ketosteroid isomerase-like protein